MRSEGVREEGRMGTGRTEARTFLDTSMTGNSYTASTMRLSICTLPISTSVSLSTPALCRGSFSGKVESQTRTLSSESA